MIPMVPHELRCDRRKFIAAFMGTHLSDAILANVRRFVGVPAKFAINTIGSLIITRTGIWQFVDSQSGMEIRVLAPPIPVPNPSSIYIHIPPGAVWKTQKNNSVVLDCSAVFRHQLEEDSFISTPEVSTIT